MKSLKWLVTSRDAGSIVNQQGPWKFGTARLITNEDSRQKVARS